LGIVADRGDDGLDQPPVERRLQHVVEPLGCANFKVSKVCVGRLDRLGRTAKGLLTLLDELQVLGVGLVSLREGFDVSTPAGRLMSGVLASVAAYETEVRKERQLAGISKAKAEGKSWDGRKAGTRVKGHGRERNRDSPASRQRRQHRFDSLDGRLDPQVDLSGVGP
jgi:DNA invertase Pin-like site-specific DNA recombinase